MPEPKPELSLSSEALTRVKGWVTAADQRRKDFEPLWDENAKKYQPPPSELTKARTRYDVTTNVDFRQVEQTKPQLFFETGDPQLVPLSPGRPMPVPMDPMADPSQPPQAIPFDQAIVVHQLVLKQIVGPKPLGVDALRCVQRALTDVLAVSGVGWVTVGYEVFTRDVPTDDPLTGETMTVKAPIYERYFMEHSSPAKGIIPSDAVGSDPDNWPYTGKHWCRPVDELRAEFGNKIPADFKGTARSDPHRLRKDEVDRAGDVDLATGYTLWIKATFLDPLERHPLKIRELVMCDGIEEPLRYRDSPYQTFTEDGRLTEDSMVGFPDYPLIIQDAPDSPYVLAQSSMTRPLVEELELYRSQSLAHRDAGAAVMVANATVLGADVVDAMKAKGYNHWIFLDGNEYPPNQPPIFGVTMPGLPRDNYEGAAIVERDIEKTHALGANQSGVDQKGRRSATEIQTIQGNTNIRQKSLQNRVLDWYCKILAKLDALVQRYSDAPQWIQILGEENAATWQLWDKHTIAGRFLYRLKPDSQLQVDAAQDRAQFLQLYNLVAQDPYWKRMELDKQLAAKFNMDPSKLLEAPPPAPPPPPKVSASIKMEDLYGPAGPIAVKLLMGQPITPEDVQIMMNMATQMPSPEPTGSGEGKANGQPPHGGVPPKADAIDAHQERRTGGLEGMGTLQ